MTEFGLIEMEWIEKSAQIFSFSIDIYTNFTSLHT